MKSVSSIVKAMSEKLFVPRNSLGVKRKDMPQIEDKDQDHFFKWLSSKGISHSKVSISPDSIKPSQSEINLDAANDLVDTNSPKLLKPVIVSSDSYLMDGHHRWMANIIKKTKSIPAIKVNMKATELLSTMRDYDKAKFKSITNEKSLAKKIIEKAGSILEKLVIVNKGAKFGQVVILAGGAGSGKGFSADKFLDTSSYKKFDVDELKKLVIAVAKKQGNAEIANLNLRNPDDVLKLHQYVSDKGLDSKVFQNVVNSIKSSRSKDLPNLLFDVTLKNLKTISGRLEVLTEIGYKPENVHIVWVLADYNVAIEQNKGRDRIVPEDIVFQTHTGAAETMRNIIAGDLPKNVDGEIYVIFSDKRLSVAMGSSSKNGYVNITDFLYSKIKDSGKPMKPESQIKKDVFMLAKEMVPANVKNLFEKVLD
jgi:dephospho-CoA kinase